MHILKQQKEAGIARVVQSYFYEMTNDEYAAFGIRNCEIKEYRF